MCVTLKKCFCGSCAASLRKGSLILAVFGLALTAVAATIFTVYVAYTVGLIVVGYGLLIFGPLLVGAIYKKVGFVVTSFILYSINTAIIIFGAVALGILSFMLILHARTADDPHRFWSHVSGGIAGGLALIAPWQIYSNWIIYSFYRELKHPSIGEEGTRITVQRTV